MRRAIALRVSIQSMTTYYEQASAWLQQLYTNGVRLNKCNGWHTVARGGTCSLWYCVQNDPCMHGVCDLKQEHISSRLASVARVVL